MANLVGVSVSKRRKRGRVRPARSCAPTYGS